MPHEHWCVIPELMAANWTSIEIKAISSRDRSQGCHIYDRNYDALSKLPYLEALNQSEQSNDALIPCSQYPGAYQNYVQPDGLSIVTEVIEINN